MRKGAQFGLIALGLIGSVVGGIPALVMFVSTVCILFSTPADLGPFNLSSTILVALLSLAGLMGLAGFWSWGFSAPQTLSRRGWRLIALSVGAGVIAVLVIGAIEFALLLRAWLSPEPLVNLHNAWAWLLLNGLGLLGVAVGITILRDARRHLHPSR